jgi:hypothetical protein
MLTRDKHEGVMINDMSKAVQALQDTAIDCIIIHIHTPTYTHYTSSQAMLTHEKKVYTHIHTNIHTYTTTGHAHA